ncbi:EAL domain-containing protein [Vibrio sp. dsl-7]|uniref:EAL domain-containing protein n=1 Tax=Vibrio chanodichtyis TaxID=3027932 RepID=A0ABT5UX58_9VIBR|nr:EAL domain-containing protein [Vibrio chanodichtyis]MDE1513676.1 EAL domain-containing protein [Vibrio chanodichtyis]
MKIINKILFTTLHRRNNVTHALSNSLRSYLTDLTALALLLLPLTLLNGLILLAGHILNLFGHTLTQSLFDVSNIIINLYPTAFCLIIGYYLSLKVNVSSATFILLCLIMFYFLSIETGSLSNTFQLPNSPILALLSALMTLIYYAIFPIRLLVPQTLDFPLQLLKHVLHVALFMLLALVIAHLITISSFSLDELSLNPMTLTGGLIYQTILGLLGAIGINGHNMLFSIKQNIFSITQANLSNWQAGTEPLNVISQGFYDAFLSMGGAGNSISLLICILLFSQSRHHFLLALAATPLVIFNINEVLLFGLPIIFNPLLIIPFITVPLVSFFIAYLAIASSLVTPIEQIVNWMTPPLISGYIATGNQFSGVLLQLVIIVVGVLIYRPFYLAYSGRSNMQKENHQNLTELVTSTFKMQLSKAQDSTSTQQKLSTAQSRVMTLLNEGELVMHYQKLHSCHEQSDLSCEALLRYIDRRGQVHGPTFISDFQLIGAMPYLDKIVIDKVLSDMQRLALSPTDRIAINIAVASIEQKNFAAYLLERLEHYAISPHNLMLEITEEAILSNTDVLLKTMQTLQAHGIHFAMDDFGTGYASFPHLLKFPFNKIKLDRTLLLDTTQHKGKELYALIAKLGRIANCQVVAEGVETQDELHFVQTCQVDWVQGYWFARPEPLEKIIAHQVQ